MNPGPGILYHKLPDPDPRPLHVVTDVNLNKADHFMERSGGRKSEWIIRLLQNDFLMRILTAFFYAMTSFLIMVVNKIVLTSYQFPSSQVLGLGQMIATILVLGLGKTFSLISFPDLSRNLVFKVSKLFDPVLQSSHVNVHVCCRSFQCHSSTWETWSSD